MVPKQRKATPMNKLPASKTALRSTVAAMVAEYLSKGGNVTVCKPSRA